MGKDALVTRHGAVLLLGALGALVVGGVSQAFLWRWGLDGLALVSGSQFMWALLTFAVSWAWAEGDLRRGALAGGATGLALVVSYYALQWAADGSHSATSQFLRSHGLAWTLAATGGGAVMGLCGALASLEGGERPRLKAFGIALPAVVVGVGPATWMLTSGHALEPTRLLPAAIVFALVAVLLLAHAVRACGVTASAQAVALAVVLGAVALAGLMALQRDGWLYLTF